MAFRAYWLANSEKWFAKNKYDKEIVELFKNLILKYEMIDVSKETYNIDEYVERILVCDQLPRHFDRLYYSSYANTMSSQAVAMTNYILENAYDDFLSLTPEEQCFVLLPLRHTRKLSLIEKSIIEVDKLINSCEGEIPSIYSRFYRASLESWADNMELTHYSSTDKVEFPGRPGLLDKNCTFDITVPIGFNKNTKLIHPIPETWKKNVEKTIPNDDKVIISLSGGGDSMTGSYILRNMGYNVTAVMVDYNNREECSDEVKMVHWWCSQLGIELYVAHITVIQRKERNRTGVFREIYESVTRRMRFNAYKITSTIIKAKEPKIAVIHNLDDCFENIITNLTKKRSMYNPKQIKSSHEEDGVIIYRPFKDVLKSEITEFLQNINGPYLRDSTPKDSARGTIRDKLVPVLDEYDKKLIPGINHLADVVYSMSQKYFSMMKKFVVLTPKRISLKISKMKKAEDIDVIEVNITRELYTDETYWSYVFGQLHQNHDYPTIGGGRIQRLINVLEEYDGVVIYNLQGNVVVKAENETVLIYRRQ